MRTRYDPEGDILTVFFQSTKHRKSTGLELNPSIVLYFDPETAQPIEIIFIDYSRLLAAQAADDEVPLTLSAFSTLEVHEQAMIVQVLRSAPIREFLELQPGSPPTVHLNLSKAPPILRRQPAVA